MNAAQQRILDDIEQFGCHVISVFSNYKALSDLSIQDPSVYSLGYGGSFDECAAAFYSAAALVRITGGSAFEPQGGVVMTESELIDAATSCLEFGKRSVTVLSANKPDNTNVCRVVSQLVRLGTNHFPPAQSKETQ
jgi:hypothetical protein